MPVLSGAEGASKGRGWGGRRPGAGAPRGNVNALRHGRNSKYHQQLTELLSRIPEAERTLTRIARRRRLQQREAESGAAALMAELFRRVGEIVLNHRNNHLESNQACPEESHRELLETLRWATALLRNSLSEQSSAAPEDRGSIKAPDA